MCKAQFKASTQRVYGRTLCRGLGAQRVLPARPDPPVALSPTGSTSSRTVQSPCAVPRLSAGSRCARTETPSRRGACEQEPALGAFSCQLEASERLLSPGTSAVSSCSSD